MTMLVRCLSSKGSEDELKTVFLPDGKPLLVGKAIFDSLVKVGYKPFTLGELSDVANSEETILLKLDPFDLEKAKEIVKAFKERTVCVLCKDIEDCGYQFLSGEDEALIDADESFESFVADITGVRRADRPKADAKAFSKATRQPEFNGVSREKEGTTSDKKLTLWSKAIVALKKDGLNVIFTGIFILLSLATELGYFLLGQGSGQAFRIACIIMAAIFPLMSCIPMGFLYEDRKCKKPTDSKFFLFSWIGISSFGILCPLICLLVGVQASWNMADLILFTCLGMSSPIWIVLRVAFAGPIQKARGSKS